MKTTTWNLMVVLGGATMLLTMLPGAACQRTTTINTGDAAYTGPPVPQVCLDMCKNLQGKCPEGDDQAHCWNVCALANGGEFDVHPQCVAAASTPSDIRACGADGGVTIKCAGR